MAYVLPGLENTAFRGGREADYFPRDVDRLWNLAGNCF